MPAARPSRPSTKFTALIVTTIAITVTTISRPRDGMKVPKIGSDSSWMPCQAISPEARAWPANLVTASSCQMSSNTPSRQTAPAESSTAWVPRPCSSNSLLKNPSWLAVSRAMATPRKIAVPPSRGIGTVCTSRSRTGVTAPIRRASRRAAGVVR